MRTKLVITLLFAAFAGSFALSAFADESAAPESCTKTAVLGFQGSYPYQDLGIDASNGTPVSQDVLALTCGHFTIDWWSSTQLSDGIYGHRGKGDEHDFELTYSDLIDTSIGRFNYQFYVAYFALDLGKGLGNGADDYIQTFGDVAYPVSLGDSWTIAPFVRYIHNFPMSGSYAPLDWVRVGGRLSGSPTLPILKKTNVSLEVAHTTDLNPIGVLPYREIWRGEFDLTKPLPELPVFGDGASITGGFKYTEHVGFTPLIRFTYSWK